MAQFDIKNNGREKTMVAKSENGTDRGLAGIESDLLQAESEFAEAEERLKKAEQERRGALAQINNFQEELDTAVTQLRKKGPPGSKWGPSLQSHEEPLVLDSDAAVADNDTTSETDGDSDLVVSKRSKAVSNEFDRLRRQVNGSGQAEAGTIIDQ